MEEDVRDRYIVYADGSRKFVRDLSIAEIHESLEILENLKPMDGTDATHDDMRERLKMELIARNAP